MTLLDQAILILGYLNERTGRAWRARNPNGSATAMAECIIARLREGYTVEDYRRVIDHKWKQWGHDDKMRQYVNPETLSRRSHFSKYLGECEEAKPVQDLAVSTKREQEPEMNRADPERVRQAIAQGWSILNGGKRGAA